MCGIVGYITRNKNAINESIEVLKKLEYRGYDSSGIAYYNGNDFIVKKAKGKISELIKKIDLNSLSSLAIAHTRWATHGEPNEQNAHPHYDDNVILVQNGIIENFNKLKEELLSKGKNFYSETDTEVIAKLIDYEYTNHHDPIFAIRKSIEHLKGAYAVALIFKDITDKIFTFAKDAPLVITKNEDGYVVSSDVNSIGNYNNEFWFLNSDEIAILSNDNIIFYDKQNRPFNKKSKKIVVDYKQNNKNGFSTFMLKEINEQPSLLIDCLKNHLDKHNNISFDYDNLNLNDLTKFSKIRIIGCGSAYNTGLNAKFFFEEYANIKTDVLVASEFRYNKFIKEDNVLNIIISQSGETADSIACLRMIKKQKECVLSITNNVNSTIANESDFIINMNCGVECAVASTKSYMISTFILNLLAIKLGQMKKCFLFDINEVINQAYNSIYKSHDILDCLDIQEYCKKFSKFKNIFFVGRGLNYYLCCEAALKLKEVSYINCNAYPAGELKHGPISLIDDQTLTFVIINNISNTNEKIYSNIKEIIARKGKVVAIANSEVQSYITNNDYHINNFADNNFFSYIKTIYIFQLISFYVALYLGNDVDNPRNLAKSVTVE